jgi:hypothetical protein
MFLDSLVGDAAWRAKYALDLEGNPIPFEIIEEEIRATHTFAVFQLRAMLAVSYFEKALYELPEEVVKPETIEALADEIELKIQGGFSPRPILSVPHIVSDEASCYYQGYTVRMCVLSCFVYGECFGCNMPLICVLSTAPVHSACRNVCPPNSRLFQGTRWIHCRQPKDWSKFDSCVLGMRQLSPLSRNCQGVDWQGTFG